MTEVSRQLEKKKKDQRHGDEVWHLEGIARKSLGSEKTTSVKKPQQVFKSIKDWTTEAGEFASFLSLPPVIFWFGSEQSASLRLDHAQPTEDMMGPASALCLQKLKN